MRLMILPAHKLKPGDPIKNKHGVKVVKSIIVADTTKIVYYDETADEFDNRTNIDIVMAD